MDIKELKGKTFHKIEVIGNEIIFHSFDGPDVKMFHEQDCCEDVSIEDINGDLKDLVDKPLLMAETVSNDDFEKVYAESESGKQAEEHGSYTWTFYKLATIKGYVDIRWYGESNGYYSEGVSVREAEPDGSFGYW